MCTPANVAGTGQCSFMYFGSGFKKQQNALEGFGKLKHSKSDSTQPIQSHMQVVLNISVLHWCDELLATARARHSVGRAGASSPKRALPSAVGTCPAKSPLLPSPEASPEQTLPALLNYAMVMTQTNIHQETEIRPNSLALAI